MTHLLEKLKPNQKRGSKARCHWLTHGTPEQVSARLTSLIEPWGSVNSHDQWMPKGFEQVEEAEMHKPNDLLPQIHSEQIRDWWLKICRGGVQKSPVFDIASTCQIGNKKGILLVEAKAHNQELIKEEAGKKLNRNASDGQITNHEHIGEAIAWANQIFVQATSRPWHLSHECHYQMSNRFALACKLTQLGYPVILVYLGFLGAEEMRSGKKDKPFADHTEWNQLVRAHCKPLFPETIWNKQWVLHNQPFIPLIQSMEIPYDKPITGRSHEHRYLRT